MDAQLGGIVDMQTGCALSYATRRGRGSGEDAVQSVKSCLRGEGVSLEALAGGGTVDEMGRGMLWGTATLGHSSLSSRGSYMTQWWHAHMHQVRHHPREPHPRVDSYCCGNQVPRYSDIRLAACV